MSSQYECLAEDRTKRDMDNLNLRKNSRSFQSSPNRNNGIDPSHAEHRLQCGRQRGQRRTLLRTEIEKLALPEAFGNLAPAQYLYVRRGTPNEEFIDVPLSQLTVCTSDFQSLNTDYLVLLPQCSRDFVKFFMKSRSVLPSLACWKT